MFYCFLRSHQSTFTYTVIRGDCWIRNLWGSLHTHTSLICACVHACLCACVWVCVCLGFIVGLSYSLRCFSCWSELSNSLCGFGFNRCDVSSLFKRVFSFRWFGHRSSFWSSANLKCGLFNDVLELSPSYAAHSRAFAALLSLGEHQRGPMEDERCSIQNRKAGKTAQLESTSRRF